MEPTEKDIDNRLPLAQLGNVITLICKQDQIVWAIFAVFWAANAVLVVAIFNCGYPPEQHIGFIVSLGGVLFSLVWFVILKRALSWLDYYEGILLFLEESLLHIPKSIAITGTPNNVKGIKVRPIMIGCPIISTILWFMSVFVFYKFI